VAHTVETHHPLTPMPALAAATFAALQAGVGVLAALALFGAARLHPRHGDALAGVLLLLGSAGVGAIAIGLARLRRWSRAWAIGVETAIALMAVLRLVTRPVAAAIGLAIATAVVALAAASGGRRSGRPGPPPGRDLDDGPLFPVPPPWTTAPTGGGAERADVGGVADPGGADPGGAWRGGADPGGAGRGGLAVTGTALRPPERPASEIAAPVSPRGQGLTAAGVLLGGATAVILLGALTIRSGVIFGLVALAVVFIPLERLFALRPQRVLRDGWRTDLVHFVVNNVVTSVALIVPVIVVGLALRAAVPASVHHAITTEPTWLQFIEAFLIAEIGGYLGHRAAHQVPLLWRFHKVHHTIREMDWLASAHLHPLDSVWTRSCIVVPLFAFGFSRGTFGGFLAFATIQAIFIHANVRVTFGPLRWVIATPEFHHWHHANAPQAYNTNFAGEFPWIDALFGTLYLPKGRMPARYGVDEEQPAGYLRQLAWPFRHAA